MNQTIYGLNKQLMFYRFDLSRGFTVISELMLFGERLAQVRKKNKVSQEALAEKLGVHAPIIGRYERNDVKPSVEVAAKIAEALGVSLDYLTGLSENELSTDVLQLLGELQALHADDQDHILKTLGALIRDAKTRKAYQ